MKSVAYQVHESLKKKKRVFWVGRESGCGLGLCPLRFYTRPSKSYVEPNMRPVVCVEYMCVYMLLWGINIYMCVCIHMHIHIYSIILQIFQMIPKTCDCT